MDNIYQLGIIFACLGIFIASTVLIAVNMKSKPIKKKSKKSNNVKNQYIVKSDSNSEESNDQYRSSFKVSSSTSDQGLRGYKTTQDGIKIVVHYS